MCEDSSGAWSRRQSCQCQGWPTTSAQGCSIRFASAFLRSSASSWDLRKYLYTSRSLTVLQSDCRQQCCSRAAPTAWRRCQCGQQCRVSPSVGCRCPSSPVAPYHTTDHLRNSIYHCICYDIWRQALKSTLPPDLQGRGRKRWPLISSATVRM